MSKYSFLIIAFLFSACLPKEQEKTPEGILEQLHYGFEFNVTYKIKVAAIYGNGKSLYLSGERVYKIKNNNSHDSLINTNFTRYVTIQNGEVTSEALGAIPDISEGEDLVLRAGETASFSKPYNVKFPSVDSDLAKALINNKVESLKLSEAFVALPPLNREHRWSIVGYILTKPIIWDFSELEDAKGYEKNLKLGNVN